MKIFRKVRRSALLTNNVCKQIGISKSSKIRVEDFDRCWRKYLEYKMRGIHGGERIMLKLQAMAFIKHFYSAIGEEYEETRAEKIFSDCDELDVGTINYDQFKKLFYLCGVNRVHFTESLESKLKHRGRVVDRDARDEECTEDSFEDYSGGNYNTQQAGPVVSCKKYNILNQEELKQMMRIVFEEISSVIGLPPHDVILLLKAFGWDRDRMMCHYYDDPDKWNIKAGLSRKFVPNRQRTLQFVTGKPDENSTTFSCPVCCDDVDVCDTYAMRACGHTFCRDCWKQHFRTVVDSFGPHLLSRSKCMDPECNIVATLADYKNLGDERCIERYSYFLSKSFVEHHNSAAFCPSGCGSTFLRMFQPSADDARPSDSLVQCKCGGKFCFDCGHDAHEPVNCAQMNVWKEKNDSDVDSLKLVTAIAKPCPQCGIPTDRTDGCNHMSCPQCLHGWCWQCRQPWQVHGDRTGGFYFCNMYERSNEIIKMDEEAEAVREDHNRFLHHFNGYHVNDKDEKGTIAMRDSIESTAAEYSLRTGGDPSFLMEALDTLAQARRTIKMSYVYAYFLPTGETSQKQVFEMQQALAQEICERLAKEVMTSGEELDRNKIVYLHKACRQYLQNLVDYFESPVGRALYSTPCRSGKTREKQKKNQTNWWICPTCTFGNPNHSQRCELCAQDRFTASRAEEKSLVGVMTRLRDDADRSMRRDDPSFHTAALAREEDLIRAIAANLVTTIEGQHLGYGQTLSGHHWSPWTVSLVRNFFNLVVVERRAACPRKRSPLAHQSSSAPGETRSRATPADTTCKMNKNLRHSGPEDLPIGQHFEYRAKLYPIIIGTLAAIGQLLYQSCHEIMRGNPRHILSCTWRDSVKNYSL
ncbi:hypothetical protein PROFUN_00876 [Planoprotostelium fungivorum]|uniref:RBR-type E3 ubiquitin transferase n=1 Tax=Planoprotostelium fungivorum TaxID=1890364 RepID=A0A2P6P080_9EUKA|nr:hypothetical protein PROFUN_00876 [Planoprotostelium fungivorum]